MYVFAHIGSDRESNGNMVVCRAWQFDVIMYPEWGSFPWWWRHQMETFSALLAICAGIHQSPVNSPHKGQWRGAFMFSFICAWINGWVNNRGVGDLRRHCGHYDVTVMFCKRRSVDVPRCQCIPQSVYSYQAIAQLVTSVIQRSCWQCADT